MNAPRDIIAERLARWDLIGDPESDNRPFNVPMSTRIAADVLDALRAGAGGADRVVLCWDGDECTLRGLVSLGWHFDGTPEAPCDYEHFRLTDVAVTSPEEDR